MGIRKPVIPTSGAISTADIHSRPWAPVDSATRCRVRPFKRRPVLTSRPLASPSVGPVPFSFAHCRARAAFAPGFRHDLNTR